MSTHNLNETDPQKAVSSYVTGFILSLIFTATSYILVTNQLLMGRTLLITILLLAMVQLLVQVIYFLHLGREAGPRWNLYFFVGTFLTMLIVVIGSVVIIDNLHYNAASPDQNKRLIDSEGIYQVGGELTGACQVVKTNHIVIIQDAKVNPSLTVAEKCDTVTFINKDSENIKLDFGTRLKRIPYAGLTNISLRKERTKTITLSQTGTFEFSDDQRPAVTGALAVVNAK